MDLWIDQAKWFHLQYLVARMSDRLTFRQLRKSIACLICLVFSALLVAVIMQPTSSSLVIYQLPTIIVITPTYKRMEQLADLTRFSQTLRLVPNVHWIVVEDSDSKTESIESLLKRSTISHTHLWRKTPKGFPGKGWKPRNYALKFIRRHFKDKKSRSAVVYFGDDDNSYDLRLFADYIRNVKTVGVWAVGLVGGALVEAPKVKNGSVIGWNVIYAPKRAFAVDMAGFAVHLNLILNTNATFAEFCRYKAGPETCFLEQLGIALKDLQPFGYEGDRREILVWHTKTKNSGTQGSNHGFLV